MNLLIRSLPDSVHKRVQAVAKKNHLSVNKQAALLIEKAVAMEEPFVLPPLIKLRGPAPSSEELRAMAREGRP